MSAYNLYVMQLAHVWHKETELIKEMKELWPGYNFIGVASQLWRLQEHTNWWKEIELERKLEPQHWSARAQDSNLQAKIKSDMKRARLLL
jgi:hypothetical protein